jgi:hypothetical protein
MVYGTQLFKKKLVFEDIGTLNNIENIIAGSVKS